VHLHRRHLLAGAAGVLAATALPRPLRAALPERLPPAALRTDLDLLGRVYGQLHPGLGRYLRPGEWPRRIAAASDWAGRERTPAEFFLTLARLTASVRCGHSYPNPNNQRKEVQQALFGGRDRVPFSFRWIGARMIVTGGRGPAAPLPPGTEVLALDDTPARRLLQAMLPLTRADGSNDAKRRAQLGVTPHERYAAFDVYRPMLAPVRGDGSVALRVRRPDGREQSIELAALTEAEIRATQATPDARPSWTFAIGADRIGRLVMPDWVTYRSQWDWRTWLDAAVDRLIDERTAGLLVDLRGNEGGTECGWHLLERLIAAEIERPRFVPRTRYRTVPAEFGRDILDTWDQKFRDWGAAARGPDADGCYRLDAPADEFRLRPRGRRYAGPVAVLVDAACSSATFQFAHAVKATGTATLVGETTGGNLRGINGSAYFFVRLPGSGLEVDLPLVGSFAATPQPDRGVVPDRLVTPTARDIAQGRDPQLAAALAIFRS
jgi:C-terminal processing protease CtpA/Prc